MASFVAKGPDLDRVFHLGLKRLTALELGELDRGVVAGGRRP